MADDLPSAELPSAELPSAELPSGELPSGEGPPGEVLSTELPSGELLFGEFRLELPEMAVLAFTVTLEEVAVSGMPELFLALAVIFRAELDVAAFPPLEMLVLALAASFDVGFVLVADEFLDLELFIFDLDIVLESACATAWLSSLGFSIGQVEVTF